MPLGTRIKIKVIDNSGNHMRTILRCTRPFSGRWWVLYEKKAYEAQGDFPKGDELSITLR